MDNIPIIIIIGSVLIWLWYSIYQRKEIIKKDKILESYEYLFAILENIMIDDELSDSEKIEEIFNEFPFIKQIFDYFESKKKKDIQ